MPRSVHARSHREKPIWKTRNLSPQRASFRDVREEPRVQGIGEPVSLQRRLRRGRSPGRSRCPCPRCGPRPRRTRRAPVAAQLVEEADVASQLEDVIADRLVQCLDGIGIVDTAGEAVREQLLPGFLREPERPRHVRRSAMLQGRPDDIPLAHCLVLRGRALTGRSTRPSPRTWRPRSRGGVPNWMLWAGPGMYPPPLPSESSTYFTSSFTCCTVAFGSTCWTSMPPEKHRSCPNSP